MPYELIHVPYTLDGDSGQEAFARLNLNCRCTMSEQPAYHSKPEPRDPRKTPRAGDVLCHRRGCTMEVTHVDTLGEVIILRESPGSGRCTVWNLSTYLRLAASGWGVQHTYKFPYEA